jgi:LL-diaminopimelate aminotransferase
MVQRNLHLAKLQAGYLFPEINKRRITFLEKNPHAQLISLGIGDTTEPIPSCIAMEMSQSALALSTYEGYRGYGPEQGYQQLRTLLAEKIYAHCSKNVDDEEVFVSDGAKCDIGRLQILFGSQSSVAIQDPSYPVYIDTSVMMGQSGNFDHSLKQYKGLSYWPCHPNNAFFPTLGECPRSDLIYFCSPNNPTGAVATHAQLADLVDFARKNRSIIIFDAAYAPFIQDPSLPRSIYEIPGAREVAIELGSFSKMVGFSGIRLAWSVVPKELLFDNGYSVHQDWNRINTTFFNGASWIAQVGGIVALQPKGQMEMKRLIRYYMQNAALLRNLFLENGYVVHGGTNAPYLWVEFPHLTSWEAFEILLEKTHIICTPGCGFGPQGEGFIRLSAFANQSHILEAVRRLRDFFNKHE